MNQNPTHKQVQNIEQRIDDVILEKPQANRWVRECVCGAGIRSAGWLPEVGVWTSSWAVAIFFLKDNLCKFLKFLVSILFIAGGEAQREASFPFRSSFEIQGCSSVSSFWNESVISKVLLSLALCDFLTIPFLWTLKLHSVVSWYKIDWKSTGSNAAYQSTNPGAANCELCDLVQVPSCTSGPLCTSGPHL